MKKQNPKTKSIVLALFLVLIGLSSCNHDKTMDRAIVIDVKGNYYRLIGDKAIGDERYLLQKIDTIVYKSSSVEHSLNK